MATYLVHEQPDLYDYTTSIIEVRPGAVLLERSAFHPGGGGQVSDVGTITTTAGPLAVTGIEVADDGRWWHLIADSSRPETTDAATAGSSNPGSAATLLSQMSHGDEVEVAVDRDHRLRVASLHTVSHVLNAFVFDEFDGALVTGAQITGDGRGRMDFDLPEVDNDRLRSLADPINRVIADGLDVNAVFVDAADAASTQGLIRSMSVAPPPSDDGRLRVIDIDGLDRQACGGTHLTNTGQSRPIQITKIENKGRHNRRVRFEFAD